MTNDSTFTFETPVKQEKMGQIMNPMIKFDEHEDEEIIGDWSRNKQPEGGQKVAELFLPEKLADALDAQGKMNTIPDYITYNPTDPLIQMGEGIETGFTPPPPGAVAVAGWAVLNLVTAGIPAMIDLAYGSSYAQEALESNY
jgi:hypothetical protein